MEMEKQNKLLGICASLGLHGLAAAILVFSLSGNALIHQDLGKLDFMWVSFAAKQEPFYASNPENSAWKEHHPTIKNRVVEKASTTERISVYDEAVSLSAKRSARDDAMVSPGHETSANPVAENHPSASETGWQAGMSLQGSAGSDSHPFYIENPPPGYPEIARQQGYEGVVLIGAEILVNGRVGEAVIRKSSGYEVLDQSAIRAVKTWKFEPAKKSGIPYKTWAELPVKFVISNQNS